MILVNGCSRTHGTWYCINNNVDPWPAVLGKQLEEEVINIAECGSSISSVVKSTVDWIETNKKPDLVICAFPEIGRFEIPTVPYKDKLHTFREMTIDDSLFYNYKLDDPAEETVRRKLCSTEPHSLEWIRIHCIHMIHYLILYCEAKDIELKTFYMSDRVWKQIRVYDPEKDIIHLGSELQIYPYIFDKIKDYDMFNDLHIAFYRYRLSQGYLGHGQPSKRYRDRGRIFDTHDDEDGHKFIADTVLKRINGEYIDWHNVDYSRITDQIKLKPHVINSDLWPVIKSILVNGHEIIDYEGLFIYD